MWHERHQTGRTVAGLILAIVAGLSPAAIADEPAATPETPEPPALPVEADAADAADGKFLLRFKFRQNQVVRYEVEHQLEITTQFSGSTEVARNTSESRRSYQVKEATPEGEADLQLMIDWVHMTAAFDTDGRKAKPIEFQSDDPTKHPAKFRHILATVGKPQATIRFDATGIPLKVTTSESVQPEKAGNAAGNGASSDVDTSHESYLVPLPTRPVALGETWKERFDILARDSEKLPVRIRMQRSYKLSQVKEGKATIEFRTAILTPVQDPAVAAQLIQRETAGKIVFDIEQGLIVSRDVSVDRTVAGPLGPGSLMHAASSYHERILPEPISALDNPAAGTTTKR